MIKTRIAIIFFVAMGLLAGIGCSASTTFQPVDSEPALQDDLPNVDDQNLNEPPATTTPIPQKIEENIPEIPEETSVPIPTQNETDPEPVDESPSLGENDSMPNSPFVEKAMADLASRLGISAEAITFVSFEEVTWPDGSVGCPQPGMLYTQALIDGTRTVLSVDGKPYNYHSGGGQEPFLCEQQPLVQEKPTSPALDADLDFYLTQEAPEGDE